MKGFKDNVIVIQLLFHGIIVMQQEDLCVKTEKKMQTLSHVSMWKKIKL